MQHYTNITTEDPHKDRRSPSSNSTINHTDSKKKKKKIKSRTRHTIVIREPDWISRYHHRLKTLKYKHIENEKHRFFTTLYLQPTLPFLIVNKITYIYIYIQYMYSTVQHCARNDQLHTTTSIHVNVSRSKVLHIIDHYHSNSVSHERISEPQWPILRTKPWTGHRHRRSVPPFVDSYTHDLSKNTRSIQYIAWPHLALFIYYLIKQIKGSYKQSTIFLFHTSFNNNGFSNWYSPIEVHHQRREHLFHVTKASTKR